MDRAPIETPCVKLCGIDPATKLCPGCGRTVREITAWGSMTPAQRREVMDALPVRKAIAGSGDAP